IKQEVERQIDVLESGGTITQETRLYDGEKDVARAMRSKEEANDYRYFPCPDLLPVVFDHSYIEEIKNNMPELTDARRLRFCEQYGLSDYDACLISSQAELSRYFETMAKISGDAKLSANWVLGELSANLNSNNLSASQCPISADQLGLLVLRVKDGTLSSSGGKKVFNALWEDGAQNVDKLIDQLGLKQVSDTS